MAYPELDPLDWSTIEPWYDRLLAFDLDAASVSQWLEQWSDLASVLREAEARIMRAVTENTADEVADRHFQQFVEQISPKLQAKNQALRDRLLSVPGYVPAPEVVEMLGRFRAQVRIYRDANVPLVTELAKLSNYYDKLIGGLTVSIDGMAETIQQATSRLYKTDRAERERAWRGIMGSYGSRRQELNELYMTMLGLRRRIARQADLPDFRAYRWLELGRFDYTPEDCRTFHDAIENEVVPLALETYEKQRVKLGLKRLRPWDVEADPSGEPLRPYRDAAEFEEGVQRIFTRVDPVLGGYFAGMRDGYLDLASRPNKAPGGYCESFPMSGKPYIFMNGVGINEDLFTLLHEGGHSFHFMEARRHRLVWNLDAPTEFSEVASMGMEYLATPYLAANQGGFYSDADAKRAYADQLQGAIRFLPYMAVVDAFQHWVYTEAPENVSAADLDAKWSELAQRFMPGIDVTGFETELATGWHRKLHITTLPFYYVEYGLASVGAMQVWRNSLRDQRRAVADYRAALALGDTRSLRELFRAAKITFAFDRKTIGELMALVGKKLAESA